MMPHTQRSSRSQFVYYALAAVFFAASAIAIFALGSHFGEGEGFFHKFIMVGFLLPLALITWLAGRNLGIFYLVLSGILLVILGLPDIKPSRGLDPAALVVTLLVGAALVYAIDTAQRNRSLWKQVTLLAEREETRSEIATTALSSHDQSVIRVVTVRALARSLHADRCYFIYYSHDDNAAWIADEWYSKGLLPLKDKYLAPALKSVLEQEGWLTSISTIEDVRITGLSSRLESQLDLLPIRSVMRIPLESNGELVAALCVAMAYKTRKWTHDEIKFAEQIAAETYRATESVRIQQRDTNIAITLQEMLLPSPHIEVPGLDIGTVYSAALEEAHVGGDFYDVFSIDKQHWALVVGDVSGKGLKAATQIATIKNMLRYVLYQKRSIQDAITELNVVLTNHNLVSSFVTLFIAVFDAKDSSLRYVSCGHEPAILKRATGAIEQLEATGPVLGVMGDAVFLEYEKRLLAKDMMLVYTDGASEVGVRRDQGLKVEGLSRFLTEHDPSEKAEAIVTSIFQSIKSYAHGVQRDDICLLVAVARP